MRYLIFVLALCISSSAWACVQKDLAGTWLLYAADGSPAGNGSAVCGFNLNNKGGVIRESSGNCIGAKSGAVWGGKLVVSDRCIVEGSIKINRYDEFASRLISGSLDAGKTVLGGAFMTKKSLVRGTFTAIRHDIPPQ